MILVREILPGDAARWDAYVLGTAESHFAQRTAWRAVVERHFGVRARWWLAERDGRTCGVLPLFARRDGALFSAPGGVLADDPAVAAALLEPARRELAARGGAWIELRDQRRAWPELETVTEHVTLELELAESVDAQWQALGAKLRNQVGKGEKAGLRARWGAGHAGDFHRVLLENLRDLGTPVLSARFYREALEAFAPDATVLVLDKGGTPAGAMFLVRHGETMFDPWASSLRRFSSDAPNMMLYWHALKYAIEQGARRFDFGRSQPDSGTFRFKTQWGARPVPLFYQYALGRADRPPTLAGQKDSLALAVKVWQRLPLPVARVLGPAARRRFPEAL